MMMQERWFYAHPDHKIINELATTLGLSRRLARILVARNIGNGKADEINHFITPPKELVSDFTNLADKNELDKAINRVKTAISNNEKIMINGDPDADGISGTTVLVACLRELGVETFYNFPIRAKEGHGIQPRIIETAIEKGCKLLISADCGSKDIETVEYANSLGLDVIITDHHVLGKNRPPSLALVNPKTIETPSGMHSLSGSVVAFKFALVIFDALNKEIPAELFEFITAISTLGMISDRMSLLEPMNRAITIAGVAAINKTNWAGLRALLDICCQNNTNLKSRDLSRSIVPRLNAPGRIGNPEEGIPDSNTAVELLLLKDANQHSKLARQLAEQVIDLKNVMANDARSRAGEVNDINEKRKLITSQIEDELEDLIKDQIDLENDRIIIVKGKEWNPGVIGIDTDRLKERFLRPAIIISNEANNPYLRGSVRSIPSINMYNLIDEVGEDFRNELNRPLYRNEITTKQGKREVFTFGGHSQACGFCIHEDDFEDFKLRIKEKLNSLSKHAFRYSYEILDELQFHEINRKLLDDLEKLTPYGQQFEFPVFTMKNVDLLQHKPFGNKYQKARTPHVEFFIENEKTGSKNQLIAVGFGLFEKYQELVLKNKTDKKFNIIFYPEVVSRKIKGRSRSRIRLNVLDIRLNLK